MSRGAPRPQSPACNSKARLVSVKDYAENVGRARKTVTNEVLAAKVADTVADIGHDI
jgi:hypothetical protein